MNLKTFIDRPILSMVISAVILMVGLIGLFSLPIEQYPDIAPPTISVSTSYAGANAETVQKSVIVPLEEAINGVENMTYMTSTATNTGSARITVYFKQGSDPDMAAVNVQNRVSTATSLLPAEVTRVGVTTQKRQTSMLKIFGLCSPDSTYDENFLTNYLSINLRPQIMRIAGVGDVEVMGGDYAMRVWLKPDVMAQYGLEPSDVTAALSDQNIESSAGSLGEDSKNVYQYTLKYRGRYELPEEFGEIVIKSFDDGRILRLKDVADIELGRVSYAYAGGINGCPGVSCMIYQIAGSNANEIIENIDKFLAESSKTLPKGMEIVELMNTKDFLDASINEVIKTLIEAIILVVLVVYFFLQNPRSTLIPTISIFVSLIGTFAALYIAGFSINLLTLFALVLAIGTIVDDAIIVVEAVQARFDAGYQSPYKATVDAMNGISSAIVTSTLVFMAVFVPVSFMGGTSGVFYTQFGITMAVAVGISAINALTMSPALCALILKPNEVVEEGKKPEFSTRFRMAFDAAFGRILEKYKAGITYFIRHRWIAAGLFAIACVVLVLLMRSAKTGLVPSEDTGALFVSIDAVPGSTLAETDKIIAEVERSIADLPQIRTYNKVAGFGMGSGNGASHGMFIIRLTDWSEREGKENSVEAVTNMIYERTAHIKNAQLFVFAPPMIAGYGTGNSFELSIQDRSGGDMAALSEVTNNFLRELNKRPEIQRAYTAFSNNFPQYRIDIDAAQCMRAGVSTEQVLSVLTGYFGSSYVSNFNRFSKLYRVIIQAPSDYRKDLQSLDNIYVKAAGGMAPVSQFVTLTKTYGAESLARFNMFSSIGVNGMPADGYSSGDAINAIKEVAAQTLPVGYGYEFGGMTREEAEMAGSNSTVMIYAVCVLLIYLILCALYESLFVPFAVILSVPFGLMGSFLFARFWGIENNIYLQTGLIMLIGLLSKTAILLTEYATEAREKGMSLTDAAIEAASVRFRPILMTVLTMIFGMLPLMFASGVGANGNNSLGVGVVGGLLIGSLALLFVTPAFFIVFQYIEEKVMGQRKEDRK
ncbi:MAG TPA: efflux RND transporter permease subunit [Candidatus Barnesiella excrementipullorum]|uniref:Efflux RND transporter permease subunit n=1 Tax=Candidatus Barnesiella excrementipullorum TaxID=2838479 RepID=A0A9D1VQY3_9BACT|nr:efflux RND transporter permease subunit [Candidatus Barnesiella excrementipullorum]